MRIALIIPGNLWFCPYLNIYKKILDKENIKYDIISWNRDRQELANAIQFTSNYPENIIGKFFSYFEYTRFIKRQISKYKYDKLIIFGPQIGILISNYLIKHYKKKYIFDFRDLSIEQYPFFRSAFISVLSNSFANFISSPGFKRCLPPKYNYLVSHNFDIDKVMNCITCQSQPQSKNNKIVVLTIGGIRDYCANVEIIKALANNDKFELQFVGKGPESNNLQKFVNENHIKNAIFSGYYEKSQEAYYILKADILNIYYPNIITHSTALSNRFYNALIYKKPMIVTSDSIQGDFVEKYNLGLSIKNCHNLATKITDYLSLINTNEFTKNCISLLNDFLRDYTIFERTLKNFLSTGE